MSDNKLNFRLLREDESEKLTQVLTEYKSKVDKVWVKDVSAEEVVYCILNFKNGCNHVLVNETYLIVFGTGSTWYSTDKVLEERLVIKFYDNPNENFDTVMEALEVLAKCEDCKHIVVGSAFSRDDEWLVKKYGSYGFKVEAFSLFKKVDYGIL